MGHTSFESLVDTFCAKAQKTISSTTNADPSIREINWKENLVPLFTIAGNRSVSTTLQILNVITNINEETPIAEFLSYTNEYRKTLRLRVKMDNLCAEMRTALTDTLNIPIGTETFFNGWRRQPLQLEHLKNVGSNLQKLKENHDCLSEAFRSMMRHLNEPITYFCNSSEAFKTMYSKLADSNRMAWMQTAYENVYKTIDKHVACQSNIFNKLKDANVILQRYNNDRLKWAHFIIGIENNI